MSDRPTTARALAPDLARGMMLLFIALANIPWYLGGAGGVLATHPPAQSLADRVVQFFMITAVDMRVYPMFTFLLGYGMVQFARSRQARGLDDHEVRRRLRRRHLALLFFGLVHAALLFSGDVLGAYGLAGLILVALFFRRSDSTLAVWCWILAGLLVLGAVLALAAGWFLRAAGIDAAFDEAEAEAATPAFGVDQPDYLLSMGERLQMWLGATVSTVLMLVIPLCILLGWLAARHRVVEEPGRHLRLLRLTAVVGILLGWLGGLPQAAHHVGLIDMGTGMEWMYVFPRMTTGVAAGLGYVALFALIAHARAHRLGAAGRAVSALGRRSLSGYLAPSVVFAPLLSAWAFGLGATMTSTVAAAIAAATWLLTVAAAAFLESRGQRGPAEIALRRIVDGAERPAVTTTPS